MSGLAGTLRGLRLPSRRKRSRRRRRKDKPLEYTLLLTATMCLLTFGVVMVFSASSSASLLDNGDSLFYLEEDADVRRRRPRRAEARSRCSGSRRCGG